MTQVAQALRCIRDITKATVLFVHHTGKPKHDGSGGKSGHLMRGSSALYGAIDAGLVMVATITCSPPIWENDVDIEVRGAPGAGRQRVRLELKGDKSVAGKTAAHWTTVATEDRKSESVEEKVDAALRECAVALGDKALATGIGVKVIREEAEVRMAAVNEALVALQKRGRAKQLGKGKWVPADV
jgi:hypothetical protein